MKIESKLCFDTVLEELASAAPLPLPAVFLRKQHARVVFTSPQPLSDIKLALKWQRRP